MTAPFAVDSSAIIAILNNEAERDRFFNVMAKSDVFIGCPTIVEIRLWVTRRLDQGHESLLSEMLGSSNVNTIAFDDAHEVIASRAYRTFGKGRHPAKLNYGDCMAYAVAMRHNVPLLFKGADFGHTDVKVHPMSAILS